MQTVKNALKSNFFVKIKRSRVVNMTLLELFMINRPELFMD